jgi:TRAP-type C4-dicarboxylate transport system substrate-binding protein
MKRLFVKSLLAVAAVATFGVAMAQERVIKFGLSGPEGHPAVAGMKLFAAAVEAKSGAS